MTSGFAPEKQERCRAFISYRHAEADTAVAREVQRRLEHFRIPKEIRRQTGIKRIGRIFRDENELPVTHDIGEDIRKVLTEADFLIVICSTHTAESLWVEREIRFFLTAHDKKHVVTVLADGIDPGRIIPSILLEDEEGNPAEPLSCDFRPESQTGKKVQKRTETARLAAALLGCGLDQLMQRLHQHEMRVLAARMGMGMAVLAVIAGIVIDGSRKLEIKNKALIRGRSSYLAQASENEQKDGHGVLARLLALEAAAGLEKIGDERYPELYRALASSTLSYDNPWSGEDRLQTVRTYSDSGILYARCFEEVNRLVTVDELGQVAVTDSVSGEELFRKTYSVGNTWLTSDDMQQYIMPYGGESILIRSNGEDLEHFCLTEIGLLDGKEERSETFAGNRYYTSGVLVLPGKDTEKPDLVLARTQDSTLPPEGGVILERLDGETWSRKEYLAPEGISGENSFLCPSASPDGRWAAFAAENMNQVSFMLWDLEENKVISVPAPEEEEDGMGNAAVCSIEAGGKFIFSILSYGEGKAAGFLYALDPESGKIVWSANPDDGTGAGDISILQLPDEEPDQDSGDADAETGPGLDDAGAACLTAASDYSVWKISLDDGKTLSSATYDRKILSVGESDRDYTDVCLEDGRDILQPWEGGDWVLVSQVPIGEKADLLVHTNQKPWMASGSLSRLGASSYVVVQGKEAGIIRQGGDPDFEVVSGTKYGSSGLPWDYSVTDSMEADGKLLFAAVPLQNEKGEGLLLCVDPQKDELKWTSRLSFSQNDFPDLRFDGLSGDGQSCYVTDGVDPAERYRVNLADGSTEKSGNSGLVAVKDSGTGAVTDMEASGFEIAGCVFYDGELLIFTTQNEVIRCDPGTGKVLGRFEALDAPFVQDAPVGVHTIGDGMALFEQKAQYQADRTFLLVDTKEWIALRSFSGTVYCDETKNVYDFGQVSEDGSYGIYCYPVWSLKQLIGKAEDLTEKQKLSPQEQARFGLQDLG